MHKFANPGTAVPGAVRRIDPGTMLQEKDEHDRPLWDMPSPTSYVQHKRRRKLKNTGAVIEELVMVPIYRGASASFARYTRAQLRRTTREAALKELNSRVGDKATEEITPLDLEPSVVSTPQEADDTLRDLVLNPGEQHD